MNIALISDGTITALGDYRTLFPLTSFTDSGPDDEFLVQHNAMKVNVFKPHDRSTQKLVSCDPYIENNWVYTVKVEALTEEDIAARNNSQAAEIRAERNKRLLNCDWTQLVDAPVDSVLWATYRQALRDISQQQGFPWNITWPLEPELSSGVTQNDD